MFMIHEQPQILNYIRIQISDAISACNYTADEYKSSVTIIVASDKSVTRPFSSNLVKMKQDREKAGFVTFSRASLECINVAHARP